MFSKVAYFRFPNAFGQGCKSVPHAKFYNLSTEYKGQGAVLP